MREVSMMMEWFWTILSIPLGELGFYWVLVIVSSMIASAGWALYLTERKSVSAFSHSFHSEENNTLIIHNPQEK